MTMSSITDDNDNEENQCKSDVNQMSNSESQSTKQHNGEILVQSISSCYFSTLKKVISLVPLKKDVGVQTEKRRKKTRSVFQIKNADGVQTLKKHNECDLSSKNSPTSTVGKIPFELDSPITRKDIGDPCPNNIHYEDAAQLTHSNVQEYNVLSMHNFSLPSASCSVQGNESVQCGKISGDLEFSIENSEIDVENIKSEHLKCNEHGCVCNGYECEICGRRFLSKVGLDIHKKVHTMEEQHKCGDCGIQFSDASSLETHQALHNEEKLLLCDVDDKNLLNATALFGREKNYYDEMYERTYECKICKESFCNILDFKNHKNVHIGQKRYECHECDKIFNGRSGLYRHRRRVHTKEKQHECSDCGKTFFDSSTLVRHKRIHTGIKPFKCEICHKAFFQATHLKTHKRIHTGYKPYLCDECGKSFSLKSTLASHKITHTGEKRYMCDDCGKKFPYAGALDTHKRIHTGERPYECETCHKKFSQAHALKSHNRVHTREKPYECSHCGKKFSFAASLVKHERIHTGEKPYQCSYCSKAFSATGDLLKHKRTHTGEKPYECEICHKRFSQAYTLKTHRRIHTGERPYGCEFCQKTFSHACILRNHIKRIHTGDKPYECVDCNEKFSSRSDFVEHKDCHNGQKPVEQTVGLYELFQSGQPGYVPQVTVVQELQTATQ